MAAAARVQRFIVFAGINSQISGEKFEARGGVSGRYANER